MNFKLEIKPRDLVGLKRIIEKKVGVLKDEIALKLYNQIILNGSNYPYWSGGYITSFTINAGTPKVVSNESKADLSGGDYGDPEVVYSFDSNPYETVYISNYSPHRNLVENIGTFTSDFQPWETSIQAKNVIVGMYKYSKK